MFNQKTFLILKLIVSFKNNKLSFKKYFIFHKTLVHLLDLAYGCPLLITTCLD